MVNSFRLISSVYLAQLIHTEIMKLPTIIVNFKLYEQATGDAALELAKIHDLVARETGASIGIAVNYLDLARVVAEVEIPVFAQHVDPCGYGSGTGMMTPHLVKEYGAFGTLLNHSERPMEDLKLRQTIEMCREIGLFVVACADTPERGAAINKMGPDLVAVEPPELIGGDVSVSKAGPNIIEEAVRMIGSTDVLVGAGIKDADDVRIACSLGSQGVLLASGVTKSEDPYATLLDLVAGLPK